MTKLYRNQNNLRNEGDINHTEFFSTSGIKNDTTQRDDLGRQGKKTII